jgi:thioredoxin-related protein
MIAAQNAALAPTRLGLTLACTLLLWMGLALAETRDPMQHFFDSTFGDFSEELRTAREDGKKGVMLMFEMDECPFCHRMKETVLNQSEVQDYFKANFLIFPVDIEGDVEVTGFSGESLKQKDFALKSYRVRATPVFAFFDLDGKLIAKYVGATRDKAEFMLLGRFVVDGHYKDQSFEQFKRGQTAAAGS